MTTRLLVFNGTTGRDVPQPFGAEALEGMGHDLIVPRGTPLPARSRDVVHHRWGVRIDQLGWREARRADLVLAYLEPNIAYPGTLRRIPWSPLRRTPLIGIFCWAAEELLTADEQRRRRLRRMLAACDVVAFFSRNQEEIFVEHGVPRDRLVVLPFGIDTSQFSGTTGDDARDIDLLSVGWDRGRDYKTLARAVDGIGVRTTVVAPPERFAGRLPPEMDLVGTVSHPEYRALLRRARVVVVPTRDLAYPTGQTVAMEAAAAGCAVVVSRTEAMGDYFTDGTTAEMPEVGDVVDLRERISGCCTTPIDVGRWRRGRAHAHKHFDHARLWQTPRPRSAGARSGLDRVGADG